MQLAQTQRTCDAARPASPASHAVLSFASRLHAGLGPKPTASLAGGGNDKTLPLTVAPCSLQPVEMPAKPVVQAALQSPQTSVEHTLEAALADDNTNTLAAAIHAAVQALAGGSLNAIRMTEVRDVILTLHCMPLIQIR